MIITGMDHFQSVCKKKLVEWYNNNGEMVYSLRAPIDLSNVFIVWSCKTLQNLGRLRKNNITQYNMKIKQAILHSSSIFNRINFKKGRK